MQAADIRHQIEASPGNSRSDLNTVHSVDKALLIIEFLMRHGEAMTARELALQTGINRTTGHRLLNALIHRGWIEKEPNTASYRISLRHLVLSNLAYQRRDVLSAMRPTLEYLSNLSRETVHVGVLDGFDLVHVERVDSPERVGVSSKIGTRVLPHLTSLGKAILAASPAGTLDAYLDHLRKMSEPKAPFDSRWLIDEIENTRLRGYSIDDEEDSLGVRCIGSAIMAGNGEPIFAVSITGPSGRFTTERAHACAPALVAATASLSSAYGWSVETNRQ
jgi:DNA-binding IclR family transcriptional regulator